MKEKISDTGILVNTTLRQRTHLSTIDLIRATMIWEGRRARH
jgi:hypothetical protein